MRWARIPELAAGTLLLALVLSCSKDRNASAVSRVQEPRASHAAQSPAPDGPSSASSSVDAAPKRDMFKLYKRRTDGTLAYHEAWHTDSGLIEHWGTVGENGETREHPSGTTLDGILAEARKRGFSETTSEHWVIIEYKVKGMGTVADLDKRHALEERMNETLGWTGLGHCDGGSIGSGTMEVALVVVDAEIAKRVIATDLKGTRFQDYSRIYVEEGE